MDRKLRQRLEWLTEELREEEPEILPTAKDLTRAERFERQKLEQLDPTEYRSVPVRKRKGGRGLLFLILLGLLGILYGTGWWQLWLK